MGVVYLAHDPHIDRQVALKVLREEHVASGDFTHRFLKEAKAVGRLSHPGIVTVYDVDRDGEIIYIAMEFIEGDSLNELMKKKKLTLEEIADLGIQVAEALNYSHSRGVVHRDIKPGNLLVKPDGTVKITDFGIARFDDPTAAQLTQTGELIGTPAYMSPEQVAGKTIDGRSDLYSLGVILYELSAGERPFKAPNIASMLRMIAEELPTAPATICPDVPQELSQVIMKSLNKECEKRYQTGSDLAEALKRRPAVRTAEKTPPPMGERRRKSMGMPIALSILACLLVLGGGLMYSGKLKDLLFQSESPPVSSTTNPTTQPPVAPEPRERATEPPPTASREAGETTQSGQTVSPSEPRAVEPPAAGGSPESAGGGKGEGAAESAPAVVASQEANDSRFQQLRSDGIKAFEEKRYEESYDQLTRALAVSPDADAYYYLLSSLIGSGRLQELDQSYVRAVQAFPRDMRLYEVYARNLSSRGMTAEARAVVDGALKVNPNDLALLHLHDELAAVPGTSAQGARSIPPPPSTLPVSPRTPRSAEKDRARTLFRFAQKEHPSLKWDQCLADEAAKRAKDMVERRYFEHEDPKTGKNPAWKLVSACRKSKYAGENLAKTEDSAEEIHKAFMKSSTHRKNILDPRFSLLGVGCYDYICVEFFAG